MISHETLSIGRTDPCVGSKGDRLTRIMHVVGARPNFVKIAPLVREMALHPREFQQTLVHTGQHYDASMSQVFFRDLELPRPDINLETGSASHAQQTAQIMQRFEPVLLDYRPDWVIVPGDVNSTLACSLVASKLGVKVAHLEAGLRSFDRSMPEEINRVVTDHLSDLLFTTEPSGNENLEKEGIPKDKIRYVGNTMIDTLVHLLPRADARWPSLRSHIGSTEFALVTLHRPSNVDSPAVLSGILSALIRVSRSIPVVFPVHPRTRQQLSASGDESSLRDSRVRLIEPLGYLDFLALERHASLVITDSGGVQEETTFLGVPCLTVRPNTERPITLTLGTNHLVSSDPESLSKSVCDALLAKPCASIPPLWDGRAAQRIVAHFRELENQKLDMMARIQ